MSSLFRWIGHEFAAGSFKYLCPNNQIWLHSKSVISVKPFSSLFRRQMSTASEARCELPSTIQNSSPWLMLPPAFEGGSMSHNFYSLAENKVITLVGSAEKEIMDVMLKPTDHRVLRGSSHGWLALFNKCNLDLFLYNPISRRHIKLPPIHNMPKSPPHSPSRNVTKVILSCSPDEDYENCRAVITHDCTNMMAFCCPGRSKEWTPFGRYRDGYDECVYSSTHQLLFGLTNIDDCLEIWDLHGPSSPKMIMSRYLYADDYSESEEDEEDEEDEEEKLQNDFCLPVEHLVVTDHDLLVVRRYIMESVSPDGSYVDCYEEGSYNFPHLTVGFDVHKYDPEKGNFPYVDSLGGLALFIGLESHTVALQATHFPGVKPNSIYFTDTIGTRYWTALHHRYCDDDAPFGGHDIGIFNYEDKTVSSCYYPCDVQSIQKILPSPMWFFPSSPI